MPLCGRADAGVLRGSNVLWRTVGLDRLVHGRLVVDAARSRDLLETRLCQHREVQGNVFLNLLLCQGDMCLPNGGGTVPNGGGTTVPNGGGTMPNGGGSRSSTRETSR